MKRVMTSVVEDRTVDTLARSPLRLALVQARTPLLLAIEQPAEAQKLADRLSGWTLTHKQSAGELALEVGPHGIKPQTKGTETVWVFTEAGGGFRAAVSASSMSVECDRYIAWPQLRAAIEEVLVAVGELFAPAACLRFGARYVNELRDERLDGSLEGLRALLREPLIAPALALDRPVVRSLAELRVSDASDAEFVLRHGLVEPRMYLLDFDCYTATERPFDPPELLELAELYHARIESVFAWALTKNYMQELRDGARTTEEARP